MLGEVQQDQRDNQPAPPAPGFKLGFCCDCGEATDVPAHQPTLRAICDLCLEQRRM